MVSILSVEKIGNQFINNLSDGRKLVRYINNYGTETSTLYNAMGDLVRRVEITPHETGKWISTTSTSGRITHCPNGITQYENLQRTHTNISDNIINGRKVRTIERIDANDGKTLSKIDIEI